MDIAALIKAFFSLLATAFLVLPACGETTTNDYRKILAQIVVTEDTDAQIELTKQLIGSTDELVSRALTSWRMGELYVHTTADGVKVPLVLDGQLDSEGKAKGVRLSDGQFVVDTAGNPLMFLAADLTPADTSSKLRKAVKTTLDLFAIGNPMPAMRRD